MISFPSGANRKKYSISDKNEARKAFFSMNYEIAGVFRASAGELHRAGALSDASAENAGAMESDRRDYGDDSQLCIRRPAVHFSG